MTYLEQKTEKYSNDFSGMESTHTKGSYGKPGLSSTYNGGDDPIIPDKRIFPLKWTNHYFPIRLICEDTYLANDTDYRAAQYYLKEQFGYSDVEVEKTLSIYKEDESRTFWQTYFKPKSKGDELQVGESCGGYLWRLFRGDQSQYSAKRDFLILLMVEYKNDDSNLSPKELNNFLRAVNDLPVELNPVRFQEIFYEEEDKTFVDWWTAAHKREAKRRKTYSGQPKPLKNTQTNEVAEMQREDVFKNDLEEKAQLYEEAKESEMLDNPYNYKHTSNNASSIILQKINQVIFEDENHLLNNSDFYKRFSKYLRAIILNQVKYNYVMSQKMPLRIEEFEQYAPQIDANFMNSDGGKKAEKIIAAYRRINARYGVPPIEMELENDSNRQYKTPIYEQMQHHNEEKIKNNIVEARTMQRVRYAKDLNGNDIYLDGEIPSNLRLSDEILDRIIRSKPEDLNYKFLLNLINDGLVNSLSGFRYWRKTNEIIDLDASSEYMQVEKYVRSRAYVQSIRKNNLTYLSTGTVIPIQATILPDKVSPSVLRTVPIELRLYLKKINDNEWQVIDLTNPVDQNPVRPIASGKSEVDAILSVLEKYSEKSDAYVPGKLVVTLPPQYADSKKMIEYPYNGDNWEKKWSEWMDAIGGVMTNIGMVLRLIPHPFAQAASSGFMIVGQIASGSSAGLNIAERIEKGQFAWDLETLNDGLGLVGSVSGTVGTKIKGNTKLYFNTVDKSTEVGGYVMIPVTLQSEIDKIRKDNTKTDVEKQQAINGLVKSTVWEQGKEIFFDRVSGSVSNYHQNNAKRTKALKNAQKDAQKEPNKKVRTQLPQIEVNYKSLGSGKVAKLSRDLKIQLNKDIIINRKKRFHKAIKEEKAHVWVKMLYAVEPEVYTGAISRIKDAVEFSEFKKSKAGLKYATLAKQNGYSDKEINNFLAEEFLAKVINNDYKVLTFNSGAGSKAYQKLIAAIEKLIEMLGLGEGKITISQLGNVIKSGQKQMVGKGDYITREKAEKILAFFEGKAEIDISILGQRQENVKLHEGADKEILFREMYQLDDGNVSNGMILNLKDVVKEKSYNYWSKKDPQMMQELEEFYKNIRFLEGANFYGNDAPITTLKNYKLLAENADFYKNVAVNFKELDNGIVYDDQQLKEIIQVAKEHLFIKEHRAPNFKENEGWLEGRFTLESYKVNMWMDMYRGYTGNVMNKNEIEESQIKAFKALMIHEYIEARLMQRGVPFRNFKEPGAHQFSFNENKMNFEHFSDLGVDKAEIPVLNEDLSNIDHVIDHIFNLINK